MNIIIVNILSILITAILTYYFAKQRYTFEKLFDRKSVCLEEMYGKIISLEKDLNKYIQTTGSMITKDSLASRQKEIKPIQNKFFELQEYFWKKEIILNESSVTAMQSFIDTSINILSKLQTSIISQSINDYKTSQEQWDSAYRVMKDKLADVKQQLKKDFGKRIKK